MMLRAGWLRNRTRASSGYRRLHFRPIPSHPDFLSDDSCFLADFPTFALALPDRNACKTRFTPQIGPSTPVGVQTEHPIAGVVAIAIGIGVEIGIAIGTTYRIPIAIAGHRF